MSITQQRRAQATHTMTGERYTDLHKVGEGTFGVVYRAKDVESGELVAIKRIKLQREGKPCPGVEISALDEIRLLQVMSSPRQRI